MRRLAAVGVGGLAACVALLAGCAAPGDDPDRVVAAEDRLPEAAGDPLPEAAAGAPAPPDVESIGYRIDARTPPEEAAEFAAVVGAVLTDPRGWARAGLRFVETPDAPYTILLAEGPEVDAACRPYETRGRYSCQNGPVVALNADRWRSATREWPGDLEGYRIMLVNHEVGHLLHLHHPDPQCPGPGLPAPVMAQQSTTLDGCLPNPWPLQWEIDLATQRREPLAPPYDHDPSDHRPSPPPATW
ncbi:MAG TPA: DUF3152 domain-containing protein [Egibacteraceae bacterium]|nr:DUF3152 domain-containing protein [Egibacteraceae bacterium]